MKKTLLLTVTLLIVLTSTAYAVDQSRTIIKEYEFVTNDTDFQYDAPMEITENGIRYEKKDVRYEVIRETLQTTVETKKFKLERTETGLEVKDDSIFVKALQVNESGFIGEIPLKEITYTERKITGRTASHTVEYDYGLQSKAPHPLPTLDVLYHDDDADVDVLVTLDFVRLKETVKPHLKNNITVEQTYRSIYKDEYLLTDGTRLSFNSEKPQFEGIEEKILQQMRLTPKHHVITGSQWIGEAITQDSLTSRLASYTVERYVSGYAAVYSGTFDIPNMLVYDATAMYEAELSKEVPVGTEYIVKAIVTYEEIISEEEHNPVGIIVGTTTGTVALCGLVVFIVKRKREKMLGKHSR